MERKLCAFGKEVDIGSAGAPSKVVGWELRDGGGLQVDARTADWDGVCWVIVVLMVPPDGHEEARILFDFRNG